MANYIDLNCDLGEGFGCYTLGDDNAMLALVSSINLACGFHAGDPCIMANTVVKAKSQNINVGAHPSFRDLHGFGRREIHGISDSELRNLLIYQMGALQAIARANDYHLTHVRAHGAMGNMSDSNPGMAKVLVEAIMAVDSGLSLMTLPACAADMAAGEAGLHVVRQVFADRAYNDDGSLVSRRLEGAVIHGADFAANRIMGLLDDGFIKSINGNKLPMNIDTVVVHGDTDSAVKMTEKIRLRLENNGVQIKPFLKGKYAS